MHWWAFGRGWCYDFYSSEIVCYRFILHGGGDFSSPKLGGRGVLRRATSLGTACVAFLLQPQTQE